MWLFQGPNRPVYLIAWVSVAKSKVFKSLTTNVCVDFNQQTSADLLLWRLNQGSKRQAAIEAHTTDKSSVTCPHSRSHQTRRSAARKSKCLNHESSKTWADGGARPPHSKHWRPDERKRPFHFHPPGELIIHWTYSRPLWPNLPLSNQRIGLH